MTRRLLAAVAGLVVLSAAAYLEGLYVLWRWG